MSEPLTVDGFRPEEKQPETLDGLRAENERLRTLVRLLSEKHRRSAALVETRTILGGVPGMYFRCVVCAPACDEERIAHLVKHAAADVTEAYLAMAQELAKEMAGAAPETQKDGES